MTVFLLVAGALLAGALLLVLPPLLRTRASDTPSTQTLQAETALAVLREQLAELEAEHRAGRIDTEEYQRSRAELEQRALDEGQGDEARQSSSAPSRPARGLAALIALALPTAAIALYLIIGTPEGMDPAKVAGEQTIGREQMAQMVEQLANKLDKEPDNAEGWFMLARSYTVLEDFPRAAQAYARLAKLVPDNPNILADWADTLAAANGSKLAGEPEALALKALAVAPDHPKALALAGSAARERGDFARAAELWERILAQLPPDQSELANSLRTGINEARAQAGLPPLAAAPVPAARAPSGLKAKVEIRLDEALRAQAAPDDTVFVFARPADARMPLASLKLKVSELPRTVDFAEVPLMIAGSAVPAQLIYGARISKSGNAMPQPGDLEGLSAPQAADAPAVLVTINQVRP